MYLPGDGGPLRRGRTAGQGLPPSVNRPIV